MIPFRRKLLKESSNNISSNYIKSGKDSAELKGSDNVLKVCDDGFKKICNYFMIYAKLYDLRFLQTMTTEGIHLLAIFFIFKNSIKTPFQIIFQFIAHQLVV